MHTIVIAFRTAKNADPASLPYYVLNGNDVPSNAIPDSVRYVNVTLRPEFEALPFDAESEEF